LEETTANILDFVLMIVSLLSFLLMLVINIVFGRYFHFLCLALFLVPPPFFYFLWRHIRYYELRKTKRIVIRTIGIVLSAALLLFSSGKMLSDETFVPVKDPGDYQHMLRLYDYPTNTQMAHFPKKIPADAKDVKFYELPGFLQGGDNFVLKYRTTSAEIANMISEYEGKAKAVVDMSEYNSDQSDLGNGICMPELTSDMTGYGSGGLPDDFRVFILETDSDGTSWNNHGTTSGFAVSTQRNEIVYWYEVW
jgi:hypothetical protein